MSIVLFEDITTESILQALEAEGKQYDGLYVDMDNAPERKYVKDKASDINKLLKALDRARIDKSKEYKSQVEAEAAIIKQRLEDANRPFSMLIDAHKKKRDAILAEEKRIADAKEMAVKFDNDHELALLMDEQVMWEKHLAEENKIKYEAKLKEEAVAKAIENQRLLIEAEEQKRVNEEKARLANTEYLRSVNRAILNELIMIGLNEDDAKAVIKAIAGGTVPNVSIQY